MEKLTWNNLLEKDGKNRDFSQMTEKEKKDMGNWIFRETAESLGFQKNVKTNGH